MLTAAPHEREGPGRSIYLSSALIYAFELESLDVPERQPFYHTYHLKF